MTTVALTVIENVAFQNIDSFKVGLTNWLERADLVGEYDAFIALAEDDFNRRIWSPDREALATLVTQEGETKLPERNKLPENFPNEFWALRAIKSSSSNYPLRQASPQAAFADVGAGKACYYSIQGRELVLEPPAYAPDSLTMLYWTSIGPLVKQSTNWLLQRHPSIYLTGVLAVAEARAQNFELSEAYAAKCTQLIADLNKYGNLQRTGAAPIQIVLG